MFELLENLVSTKSLSCEEEQVAALVMQWANRQGFNPKRHLNNVYFEVGQGAPRLLYCSHIDTVAPCSGWDNDPWTPVLEGEKLTGLGANDAKGCVSAMLLAARRLDEQAADSPGSLVVAITAEEENGGANGITSILRLLGKLDAVIVGEPTGLAPCTAQSGMLLLRCIAHGDSGHAAHASALGLCNAIQLAATDIAKLSSLSFPAFKNQLPAQPQVTMITGGISANQVPDLCEFVVDLRTTPNLDHATIVADLRDLLHSEVHCRSDRYRPVQTSDAEPIVSATKRASGKATYYSNTCSDWALIGDLPTVKIGPGESKRSHQPNEYLLKDELASAIDCYCSIAKEYFAEFDNGN